MTPTTLPAQPAPLAGTYVSVARPLETGSYTSTARDLRTIGSYVSTTGERDVTVGRYTRSERSTLAAVTRVVRTVTGSIHLSRAARA